MQLRPYQSEIRDNIYRTWGTARNVLAVLPTGAGKTVLFSDIIRNNTGPSVAIAHRQELVTQISLALARNQVPHRIIGPSSVTRLCVTIHMQETGRAFINPSAPCAVAGVDTLIRRGSAIEQWANSVTLWVQDEAHHLLPENKWGKAIALFPNARGLGVTATPERADGKGLVGTFQEMLVGPSMRDLISMGYLTDYRIFSPPTDLDVSNVPITTTGDYSPDKLRIAVRKSHLMGDVVDHYIRIANGKLGVTFATDVETAQNIADKFNSLGVRAAMVCAETPDRDRIKMLRAFRKREILQLVNVDLFGEGFDLPAIECVSMARPTQSYPLYVQQFGRGLRILEGKDRAIIIDHVGNVFRHGLPDAPRVWSMSPREKRGGGSKAGEMFRSCPSCTSVYERFLTQCPFCGFKPLPTVRSGPEYVDGDLNELDAETLSRLRGEVARVDMSAAEAREDLQNRNVPPIGVLAGVKRHRERQAAQHALREAIAWWAGYFGTGSEGYKKFYLKFGIDVLSAQALGVQDANKLTLTIWESLQ